MKFLIIAVTMLLAACSTTTSGERTWVPERLVINTANPNAAEAYYYIPGHYDYQKRKTH